MTAIFPSAVPTELQLLTAINNTMVTLNADAGIGDTSFTVDDPSPLPATGYLTFDDHESSPETIYYSGISGVNLTGVTRGADGTSAGVHVAGCHLEMRWNAAYHNLLVTELIAAITNIKDRFGLNTNIVIPTGIAVQDTDGIGIGAALVASAILSMTSTTKGVLPPRMTTTQRDAIVSPATGLVLFNTTTGEYNYYNGAAWLVLVEVNASGDIVLTTAAKGIIVTTPDGLHTVRLAAANIDADGNSSITTEVVS